MEQEVLQLLEATTSPHEGTRKSAELSLLQRYTDPAFPFALLSVGDHSHVAVSLRQAALLAVNRYVSATWSPKSEDFKGTVALNDDEKSRVRRQVLAVCTSNDADAPNDRKVRNAASLVTTTIARVDFPTAWPELLPTLFQIISSQSSDAQVHGALRLLSDLVDSGFDEDQFFVVARDLINTLQVIATDPNRKAIIRALAMSVFRSCFDTLEMVMEDHKTAVQGFLEEALKGWLDFFVEVVKISLPNPPSEEEENKEEGLPSQWRGLIALKLQVVKVHTVTATSNSYF